MFYSQFILAKKGPLGTIWIAAHLERKLRKNQVTETNISVSVDSILFPEVPIALRLSGHLLLGVVRIYSRKVNYLFHDCSEALVKIKQAFHAGAVDLPPEAATAPFHSITLPETFDLDEFEPLLDRELDLLHASNNFADHHVSSREQITLQDPLEDNIYLGSQFGLDERFPEDDAPRSGIDFDEDLARDILEKAIRETSPVALTLQEDEEATMEEDVVPIARLDDELDFDRMDAMDVDDHHEPGTPALGLGHMDMDYQHDIDGLEHDRIERGPDELERLEPDFQLENDFQDMKDPHHSEPATPGTPEPEPQQEGKEDFREGPPEGIIDDLEKRLDQVEGGFDKQEEEVGPQNPIQEGEFEKEDADLTYQNLEDDTLVAEHEGRIHGQEDGGTEKELELHIAEKQVEEGILEEKDVGEDLEKEEVGEDPEKENVEQVLEKEDVGEDLEKENVEQVIEKEEVGEDLEKKEVGGDLEKEVESEEGTQVDVGVSNSLGVNLELQGEQNEKQDEDEFSEEHLGEEDVQGEMQEEEESRAILDLSGLNAQKVWEESEHLKDIPDFEIVMSAPDVSNQEQDAFHLDIDLEKPTSPVDYRETDQRMEDVDPILQEQYVPVIRDEDLEFGMADPVTPMRSLPVLDDLPGDDDVLASLLGRGTPAVRVLPTPTVPTLPKPRRRQRKRKVVMDMTTILGADAMKDQLRYTDDIRRVRRKAPCTPRELWDMERDESVDIFTKPSMPGLCNELVTFFKRMYSLPVATHLYRDVTGSEELPEAVTTIFHDVVNMDVNETAEVMGEFVVEEAMQYAPDEERRPDVDLDVNVDRFALLEPNTNPHQDFQNLASPSGVEQEEHPSDHVVHAFDLEVRHGVASLEEGLEELISTAQDDAHPAIYASEEKPQEEGTAQLEDTSVLGVMETQIVVEVIPEVEGSFVAAGEDNTEPIANDTYALVAETQLEPEPLETVVEVETEAEARFETEAENRVETEAENRVETEAEVRVAAEVEARVDTEAEVTVETDVETIAVVSIEAGAEGVLQTGADPHGKSAVDINSGIELLEVHQNMVEVLASEEENPTIVTLNVDDKADVTPAQGTLEALPAPIEVSPAPSNQFISAADMEVSQFSLRDDAAADAATTEGLSGNPTGVAYDSPLVATTPEIQPENDEMDFLADTRNTEFLGADDDDLVEEAEDYQDAAEYGQKEAFIQDNSGWSSRTRAVGHYLRTSLEDLDASMKRKKEEGTAKLSLDRMLVGKSRKEAARMFFETLVLKTKDYIHIQQDVPYGDIHISAGLKLPIAKF